MMRPISVLISLTSLTRPTIGRASDIKDFDIFIEDNPLLSVVESNPLDIDRTPNLISSAFINDDTDTRDPFSEASFLSPSTEDYYLFSSNPVDPITVEAPSAASFQLAQGFVCPGESEQLLCCPDAISWQNCDSYIGADTGICAPLSQYCCFVSREALECKAVYSTEASDAICPGQSRHRLCCSKTLNWAGCYLYNGDDAGICARPFQYCCNFNRDINDLDNCAAIFPSDTTNWWDYLLLRNLIPL